MPFTRSRRERDADKIRLFEFKAGNATLMVTVSPTLRGEEGEDGRGDAIVIDVSREGSNTTYSLYTDENFLVNTLTEDGTQWVADSKLFQETATYDKLCQLFNEAPATLRTACATALERKDAFESARPSGSRVHFASQENLTARDRLVLMSMSLRLTILDLLSTDRKPDAPSTLRFSHG